MEVGYQKFVAGGISDKNFLQSKSKVLPSRWVNLDLKSMPSINEVHAKIVSIVTKYQTKYSNAKERELLNDQLFKDINQS